MMSWICVLEVLHACIALRLVYLVLACSISITALYQEQLLKAQFWTNTDFYGLNLSSLHPYALKDHFSQPVVG
jgi:hypothetical protein